MFCAFILTSFRILEAAEAAERNAHTVELEIKKPFGCFQTA